jgi:hypothetical protein
MPVPQKFIDVQAEPFDGCLIVMNIGKDNYRDLKMSREYELCICEAIKRAHAAGHAVLYLGDSLHGVMAPPDEFPALDGADVPRLMAQACRTQIAEFPANPMFRMAQFQEMARLVYSNSRNGLLLPLLFSEKSYEVGRWRIAGSCTIEGVKVLHPVTTISPLLY